MGVTSFLADSLVYWMQYLRLLFEGLVLYNNC